MNDPLTHALVEDIKSRRPEILVVDDDPNARELMGEFLRFWGCNVLTTDCCKHGLEVFAERSARCAEMPFSMVFVDVLLPNGNGVDLAKEMRKLRPMQPICFVSGFVDIREWQKFGVLEFSTFINKTEFSTAAKNLLISQGILARE